LPKDIAIDGSVIIGRIPTGFGIEVELKISLPDMDRAEAQALIDNHNVSDRNRRPTTHGDAGRNSAPNPLEEPHVIDKGTTVGTNYERDNQRTATTLNELTFGAIDTARPDTRPSDQIGLAFGRSTVTQHQAALSELREPDLGPMSAEYRSVIYATVFSPAQRLSAAKHSMHR
jgi:hypothetical protein